MTAKVIKTKSGYKLYLDEYPYSEKPALKVKATSNGYICKFPSWLNSKQDHYVELEYCQAEYLKTVLNQIKELE